MPVAAFFCVNAESKSFLDKSVFRKIFCIEVKKKILMIPGYNMFQQ